MNVFLTLKPTGRFSTGTAQASLSRALKRSSSLTGTTIPIVWTPVLTCVIESPRRRRRRRVSQESLNNYLLLDTNFFFQCFHSHTTPRRIWRCFLPNRAQEMRLAIAKPNILPPEPLVWTTTKCLQVRVKPPAATSPSPYNSWSPHMQKGQSSCK